MFILLFLCQVSIIMFMSVHLWPIVAPLLFFNTLPLLDVSSLFPCFVTLPTFILIFNHFCFLFFICSPSPLLSSHRFSYISCFDLLVLSSCCCYDIQHFSHSDFFLTCLQYIFFTYLITLFFFWFCSLHICLFSSFHHFHPGNPSIQHSITILSSTATLSTVVAFIVPLSGSFLSFSDR